MVFDTLLYLAKYVSTSTGEQIQKVITVQGVVNQSMWHKCQHAQVECTILHSSEDPLKILPTIRTVGRALLSLLLMACTSCKNMKNLSQTTNREIDRMNRHTSTQYITMKLSRMRVR